MRKQRQARGFVAVEFSAAVALLLIPMTLLAASLPQWSEREHAATQIAYESARRAAAQWPNVVLDDINTRAVEVARDLGVDPHDVALTMLDEGTRGGSVRVRVTITMPAIAVPGVGRAGAWHWTATQAVPIDRYRSR